MADALGPNETEAIIRPHPDVPQELGNLPLLYSIII